MSSSNIAATGRSDRRKQVLEPSSGANAGRHANVSGRRNINPIQPSNIVANLFGDMGRDKKSKLQETLRSQVSDKGRNVSSSNGRLGTATRLTVKSVFNHYCRGYLPPGQTFDYIEKKAQVMDLKHFYDFMKDFGLFPGCFSSRHEVAQLFQKLNLMSKKKESRVELSRAQFETFIQGVLNLKAPAHQRGMTSEDALNTWRRGKLSGDFSHWRPIRPDIDQDSQHQLDAITEFEDVDDKEESIAQDDATTGNGNDDDDESDLDGAVRQEIAIRNEQIRELMELIWGEGRLPSLPFLQESGIRMSSDLISIGQLQLERDQIQECIDCVGAQLRRNPDSEEDINDAGRHLLLLELQCSKAESEAQNLILYKDDLQAVVNDMITKIEVLQTRSRQIQEWDSEQIHRLQNQLAQNTKTCLQLQSACSNLERHIQRAEAELAESRQQYEDRIEIMSKELNSAMMALMNSRSELETERQRSCTLQEQVEIESSRRHSLSVQISDAVQQIGQDHEHLLQRQVAINESIVQELRQTLNQETQRRQQDTESIKSLLEQVRKLETESRRYSNDYLTEKEHNVNLQAQLELVQNKLCQTQLHLKQQTQELNDITALQRQAEKSLVEMRQEREDLSQVKEQQEIELQSSANTIAMLRNEISSLQNDRKRESGLFQDLFKEKSSIEGSLQRAQSQLQALTESLQKQSVLCQDEHETNIRIINELGDAKNIISHQQEKLCTSAELQLEMQNHIDELQKTLSQEIRETKFKMRKLLQEKQTELEAERNELQKIKEQLYQSVQVSDEHRRSENEKLEVWAKTTTYLSAALEQSGERAERLHLDLNDEKRQTDCWRRRAIEQESVLNQIANLAKIRTLSETPQ